MRGRVHAKDIPEREILACIRDLKAKSDEWRGGHTLAEFLFNPTPPPRPWFPEDVLPYPPKVIEAKMQKLADRGFLDFGVSLRTAWLTDAGKARLAELES